MREPLTITSDERADATPPPDPPRVPKPGCVLHRYMTANGWLVEVEVLEHSAADHAIRREIERLAARRAYRAEIHARLDAQADV